MHDASCKLVFSRFDALASGQAMQLLNDHHPQPLQLQFEDRAFGQFAWQTLAAGPAVWRIQITRSAQAAQPSPEAKRSACCSGGACCG